MRMRRNIEIVDAAPGEGAQVDARCECGSLLARVVDGSVELKCRRCKRVWRLALDGAPGTDGPRVRLSEGGSP